MNPIEAAVLPLKRDAEDRAEQYAKQTIESVRKELEANANDIHIVAPYPDSKQAGLAWHAAHAKYQMVSGITVWRPDQTVRLHGPCYVDLDAKLCAKFVQEAREDAADQYDKFVQKLNKKIGPAKTARLEGNHVWNYSHLFVETASGAEIWKTQMIINQSKLGKVFNQFPTRKVKEAK